jgi:IstB-like ATP binding protein
MNYLVGGIPSLENVNFAISKAYGRELLICLGLDRILHHCTTINIKRESYRLKERKTHGLNSCILKKILDVGVKQRDNIKHGWEFLQPN